MLGDKDAHQKKRNHYKVTHLTGLNTGINQSNFIKDVPIHKERSWYTLCESMKTHEFLG